MRKLGRALWLLTKIGFEADRHAATVVLFLAIIGSATSAVQALGLKQLVDALARQNVGACILAVILVAASLIISRWVMVANLTINTRLQEITGLYIDKHVLGLTAHIEGVEHFERTDYLNELDLLRESLFSLSTLQFIFVGMIGTLVQFATILVLIGRVHPLLLVLPLFGLPSIFVNFRAAHRTHHLQQSIAETRRLEYRFYRLASTSEAGKEIRIFGLGPEILRRHRQLRQAVDRQEDTVQMKNALNRAWGWSVFGAGFLGAIVFVIYRSIEHQSTVGDVVLVMMLASQVNAQVSGLGVLVARLFEALKSAERYLWLIDYAAESACLPTTHLQPAPEGIRYGIDIEHLTFRYPGSERCVLKDINLHLPAGATVAVVGENGAGKSTLIKLLCRFYEPTQGKISIDGVDLKALSMASWRERIAAGFQDSVRFELLAHEAVGVGDLPHCDDRASVEAALTRAQAREIIDTLPRGLQTQLGRSFQDGVELSGGQWQKLALGRAMMRPTPLLLVLDEPTAALDAQTEHALFQRYTEAARRTGSVNGAITLLVSHRFATVRMADLIVVVNGNRVEEAGNHEELMDLNGLYAHLYEMQAQAYR